MRRVGCKTKVLLCMATQVLNRHNQTGDAMTHHAKNAKQKREAKIRTRKYWAPVDDIGFPYIKHIYFDKAYAEMMHSPRFKIIPVTLSWSVSK